jgi:hypothetical protein
MRHFILAWVLCCCVVGAATAADSDDPQAMKGSYTLADGRVLYVSYHQRTLYAQIDAGPEVALNPAGGTVWQSAKGDLRITFQQYDNGVVSGVQLVARSE